MDQPQTRMCVQAILPDEEKQLESCSEEEEFITAARMEVNITHEDTEEPIGNSALLSRGDHRNVTSEMPFLEFDDKEDKYWGVADRDVPILIGAAAGAVGLVLLILGAVLIWYICQFVFKKEKSIYSLENDDSERDSVSSIGSVIPFSESVLFVGRKTDESMMAPEIKRSLSAPMNMRSRGLVGPTKSATTQQSRVRKMEKLPELQELEAIRVNISEEKTCRKGSSANRTGVYAPSLISSTMIDETTLGSKSWQVPDVRVIRDTTNDLPQVLF